MTYAEFKSTYSWMLKNYPATSTFCRADMYGEHVGTCETIRYTKRGTRWAETERETESMTPAFYCNCVDAVPFFRRCGGSERVSMSYTIRGYLPVEISSVSPDRCEKVVRRFSFN